MGMSQVRQNLGRGELKVVDAARNVDERSLGTRLLRIAAWPVMGFATSECFQPHPDARYIKTAALCRL